MTLGGQILKYDGNSWSTQRSGATSSLRAIWGSDANSVFTVGDSGTILQRRP